MAARQRRRPPRGRHHGFALLALLALLTAGLLYFVVSHLDAAAAQRRRDDTSTRTLARAKELLLGYAVAHDNPPTAPRPGRLPCPDTDNNGEAETSCSTVAELIGRLPWKTLGAGDLRDGQGECLWYAVSPAFAGGLPLNSATVGTISIRDSSGNALASQVVAVILAPGLPLPGQDRTAAGTTTCGGNTTAAAYLDIDATSGIDNAIGNHPPESGNNYSFVVAGRGDTFNDRLTYITHGELFRLVRARVAAEMMGDASNGLHRYFIENGSTLPFAADVPDGNQGLLPPPARTTGYVPYADLYYGGSSWLHDNGWFSIAGYSVALPDRATITLDGAAYGHKFP